MTAAPALLPLFIVPPILLDDFREQSSPAGRRVPRAKLPRPPFRARRDHRSLCRPGLRRRRSLHAVDSSLDFWLTAGRFNADFEPNSPYLGVRDALLSIPAPRPTCSRICALCSPKLGDRALQPGDEVITFAAGFPTTVNPIIQNGLVPVFVDVDYPHLQHSAPTSSKPPSRRRPGPS